MLGARIGRLIRMRKVGMKMRRERHGNQRAIATFATCDACGARFTSGRIQVEERYVIEAICNECVRNGREAESSLIEGMADPAHRRRIKGAGTYATRP